MLAKPDIEANHTSKTAVLREIRALNMGHSSSVVGYAKWDVARKTLRAIHRYKKIKDELQEGA
ncbi:hypothetical protein KKIDH5335_09890 [Vibrio fluvialis]|nr:hypothetical protein KKIDH5335_09890 [Vibrio fluvialis]